MVLRLVLRSVSAKLLVTRFIGAFGGNPGHTAGSRNA